MIRQALGVSALVLGLCLAAVHAQEPDVKAARAAADTWLGIVDAGNYAQSWETAATKSRTLKSSTSAKALPGAPDGEYVVFDFDAAYENKASATERVTVALDKDSTWRVVGYFIK
jgi:hypothetical protein